MLNYKPSIGQRNGNDTPVSVRDDGTLFGASIGGPIVPILKKPTFPNNPVNTDLTNTSTWFYKQLTDYNFINGQEYFRALYVGVDPKSDENEILGTVRASVTNNFETDDPEVRDLIDNAVTVEIWNEGKFNFASAVNDSGGVVLQDETDPLGTLGPLSYWRDEVEINDTLVPGEYYKIWIRVSCVQDEALLEYDGYIYNVSVGGLTIPIPKEVGRLNISSLYSVDLNDLSDINYILKETLPNRLNLNEILRVMNKGKDINVFYFDDEYDLNVLTIRPESDISKNKYVNTNLQPLTGCIKEAQNYTYANFSDCITMGTTGTTGTSGDPCTPETSGVSGDPCNPCPSGSPVIDVIDELLDCKFIVDIFASDKEDLNIFYILYNEFVSESDERYADRYGHRQYNWNTGVIKVDLRNVNDVLFERVEYGDTFQMLLIDDSAVFPMQDRHYWNSVAFIDDLFVISGFDVEDCRTTNNRSFLTYIWEKDIVLDTPKYQKTQIPESERNRHLTVPNRARTGAYVDYSNPSEIDTQDTLLSRSVKEFFNEVPYVQMGPPHRTAIHHGYSAITYDIPMQVDTFSVTWSFGIDDDNPNIVESSPSTGDPGVPPTTGCPTTGIPPLPPPLFDSPYYLHMLYQSDYDEYVADPYPLDNPFSRRYKNTFNSMFKIHCNGNPQNPAITVEYNFHEDVWKIITEDIDASWVTSIVRDGPKTSLDFDNVFTVNTWRKQVYGCGKKYMLNFNIYVNGEPLADGITYTDTTTDTYVLTHNHDEEFTGHLSYLEVRDGLLLEGNKYATTMFQVLSNIAWAQNETENRNKNGPRGLEFFSYRQNLVLNNLNWDNDDDFTFPIVLQGNSFNVDEEYNNEVRRTIFDFNKIDVNNPSFAFAYEGTSNTLEWEADQYDFDNDIMVVWIRLRNWRGQRITMYYGDIRVIRDEDINKLYNGYHGFWTMSEFQSQSQVRFVSNEIYDGGEPIVVATNKNGTFTLQLDKQYFFGNEQLYKSNHFDVAYDDREVHRNREEDVNNFLRDAIGLFKPGTMNLREIKGLYPLKIESDGVGGNDQ